MGCVTALVVTKQKTTNKPRLPLQTATTLLMIKSIGGHGGGPFSTGGSLAIVVVDIVDIVVVLDVAR